MTEMPTYICHKRVKASLRGSTMKKPTLIKADGTPANTLNPMQQECIKLLTDALDSAQKGDIWSCVLVACGPNDFGSAMAGPDAPRLMLGLEVAKQNILQRVTGGAIRR